MNFISTDCLPAELAKTVNKTAIAATLQDCAGVPLTPAAKVAKCTDLTLSVTGQNLTIVGGNTVTLPDSGAQALSISGNVISLTNGGSVTLPDSVAFATPAETVDGTATALVVNPADLVARENIPAQTGLDSDPALIPAPTASQSTWGTTTLGERVHYMPSVGWKVVADKYRQEVNYGVGPGVTGGSVVRGTYTAHRDGVVYASMFVGALANGNLSAVVNAVIGIVGVANHLAEDTSYTRSTNAYMACSASTTFAVAKGQIIKFTSYHEQTVSGAIRLISSLVYVD